MEDERKERIIILKESDVIKKEVVLALISELSELSTDELILTAIENLKASYHGKLPLNILLKNAAFWIAESMGLTMTVKDYPIDPTVN